MLEIPCSKCKKAINLFVDGLLKKFNISATGHYVLSLATTSEIEISTGTVASSHPARSESSRALAAANAPDGDMSCIAEFLILIFPAPNRPTKHPRH